MEKITKCLNEWNATLEALGQGKQTILIRKYNTSVDKFLLYPTVSYAGKEDYLQSFKKEYQSFVEKNVLPKKEGNKTEVKYFATVEKVIEKPSTRIGSLNKYHIWTNDFVNDYVNSEMPCIWLLRIYKLKEPVTTKRTNGMVYADLDQTISLEDMEPVLSDAEFDKIKNALK